MIWDATSLIYDGNVMCDYLGGEWPRQNEARLHYSILQQWFNAILQYIFCKAQEIVLHKATEMAFIPLV